MESRPSAGGTARRLVSRKHPIALAEEESIYIKIKFSYTEREAEERTVPQRNSLTADSGSDSYGWSC